MPVLTPSVPPLWSSPKVPALLDDVKLQFATDEVRRRFTAITMHEMLAVLNMLLTDSRIGGGDGASPGVTPKDGARGPSLVLELKRNSASARAGHSRLQQQGSVSSSITASELSPRDWSAANFEGGELPPFVTTAASRLSPEWTSAITSVLDRARQSRESTEERRTVVDRVRLAIAEWCDDTHTGATSGDESQVVAHADAARHDPAWLATLVQVRRLAEDACHSKYEAVYERLCGEAEDEGDEGLLSSAAALRDEDAATAPSSIMTRRPAHRAGAGPVGIPPFSLVIQCGRAACAAASHDVDLDSHHRSGCASDEEIDSTCFVVGCEWFQWVFLAQCPLACQSEPFPESTSGAATDEDAEATAAEQRRWRQRHCTVQLLYPSEAGFSEGSDRSSDLQSAEAEYELSEPHAILTSLLGVAMRVWCQSHPHVVAEVLQMEEDAYPQHLYEGSLFWSAWPFSDAAAQARCECAATSDTMPIPLLPGECFAHESDGDDGDDDG
ncbi:hypothetical protein NESM_000661500 [Novymonas esmeraldas]|uniref:Uncharacterized protein n=1 Tax=Novymonas esmeraldas TaxID=1808958 RepID=A0AAW0ESH3_9TRYP